MVTSIDVDRVSAVLRKLALGHLKFEYGEGVTEDQISIWCAPLSTLSEEDEADFEEFNHGYNILPEIGSRAFDDYCKGQPPSWWIVQEGRYRYSTAMTDGFETRIVLRDYLAAIAVFK